MLKPLLSIGGSAAPALALTGPHACVNLSPEQERCANIRGLVLQVAEGLARREINRDYAVYLLEIITRRCDPCADVQVKYANGQPGVAA